jgi:hypothetical protein
LRYWHVEAPIHQSTNLPTYQPTNPPGKHEIAIWRTE